MAIVVDKLIWTWHGSGLNPIFLLSTLDYHIFGALNRWIMLNHGNQITFFCRFNFHFFRIGLRWVIKIRLRLFRLCLADRICAWMSLGSMTSQAFPRFFHGNDVWGHPSWCKTPQNKQRSHHLKYILFSSSWLFEVRMIFEELYRHWRQDFMTSEGVHLPISHVISTYFNNDT